MKGKIRLAISKVLTLIVFIAPITFSVPNSYSAEYNPISVNEWSYTFDRYAIDYFNPINRGYTHNELKSKIPFYEDILGAWPTSIRFPKQVYLPKDSKETLCYSLPLQIRAEVDLGYLQYSPSPIEIEFWIRIVMQGQTLSFQSPSLIVGPQDWRGSQKIIQKEIPFCLTREIASQNITAIFVRTNLFYSRLFSEFNAPTAECFDHTTKACRYIGLYGLGIEVVQDAYSPVDEGKGFERTISALKETLLSISPFEKQNMEITRRNLTYAENELEAAKARYAKLITELEAKAKAEADAKAQAEAKAKAEADAKAQAEAKAKAEAFAKQVECEKSAGDARTLRNELIQTIAKYPKKSEQLASFLNNSELNSLCPDSLNLALLKTSIELVKLQVSSIRSTITCIKGKLTKKVTAVNPKCPSGYKRK